MAAVAPDSAQQVIDLIGDARFRAAGADAELQFGLMRRLVADPHTWGSDVTLLLDLDAAGDPRALVTMAGPHPALIAGFGEDAQIDYCDLVRALLATGRRIDGCNGAERWSEPFAAAFRAAGATTSLAREMLAYELHEVVAPVAPPPGAFRLAEPAEEGLLARWMHRFGDEVDEPWTEEQARTAVAALTAAGDLGVWERDGEPVSAAAINRRTPWSSTVALVYTPPEQRRHGYAGAVVAELSRRELAAGAEWVSLFADLANPTANHVYRAIGYRPAVTFRHHRLTWGEIA